jgi:hypothetical protein
MCRGERGKKKKKKNLVRVLAEEGAGAGAGVEVVNEEFLTLVYAKVCEQQATPIGAVKAVEGEYLRWDSLWW